MKLADVFTKYENEILIALGMMLIMLIVFMIYVWYKNNVKPLMGKLKNLDLLLDTKDAKNVDEWINQKNEQEYDIEVGRILDGFKRDPGEPLYFHSSHTEIPDKVKYKLFKSVQNEDFYTRKNMLFRIIEEDSSFASLIKPGEDDDDVFGNGKYITSSDVYKDTTAVVDAIISPDDNRIVVRCARKLLQTAILYTWGMFYFVKQDELTFENVRKLIHLGVIDENDMDINVTDLDKVINDSDRTLGSDNIVLKLYEDVRKIRAYEFNDAMFVALDALSDLVYGTGYQRMKVSKPMDDSESIKSKHENIICETGTIRYDSSANDYIKAIDSDLD